jgi:hypothetical protein
MPIFVWCIVAAVATLVVRISTISIWRNIHAMAVASGVSVDMPNTTSVPTKLTFTSVAGRKGDGQVNRKQNDG